MERVVWQLLKFNKPPRRQLRQRIHYLQIQTSLHVALQLVQSCFGIRYKLAPFGPPFQHGDLIELRPIRSDQCTKASASSRTVLLLPGPKCGSSVIQ